MVMVTVKLIVRGKDYIMEFIRLRYLCIMCYSVNFIRGHFTVSYRIACWRLL